MGTITRIYTGSDLVIPHDVLIQLGLKPGDQVMVQPAAPLPPIELSAEEQARINQVLDDLWGAWSEADEKAFYSARQVMWNSWQQRN